MTKDEGRNLPFVFRPLTIPHSSATICSVTISSLATYLPYDRRRVLARGETLPDRTYGTALFTDLSGFTALAESLAQSLGAARGAEELTRQLNLVYDALVAQAAIAIEKRAPGRAIQATRASRTSPTADDGSAAPSQRRAHQYARL